MCIYERESPATKWLRAPLVGVIFSSSRSFSARFFQISIDYSNLIQRNSGYPM